MKRASASTPDASPTWTPKSGGRLAQAWLASCYRARWWTGLLLPASWLFRALAAVRRRWLLARQNRRPRPGVPIVVVGNITLGGTGKTPLLIALAHRLQAAGWRPGIISRGYGGRAAEYPLWVTAATAAAEAGDEPLLIAAETGCPVVVGPDRLAAAGYLMTRADCDVLLSDDGLQHYRLPRDLEIVVIDAARGLGNRQCLPAGPLREPPSRLQSATWVVWNGGAPSDPVAAGLRSQEISTLSMALRPQCWRRLRDDAEFPPQPPPMGQSVHAVAGIGNPQRFFRTLKQLGLTITAHEFPDHHAYTAQDLAFGEDLPVVMTAKDAVKCRPFAIDDWWCLSVQAQLPEDFYPVFLSRLQAVAARLSRDARVGFS